jgi:uncharacterized membrane protein
MIKALLLLLDDIPPAAKLEFIIGIVLLSGAVGAEMWGFVVPANLHYLFGVLGGVMLMFASYTNIKHKDRIQQAESERQRADVELRKARLAAGGSPDDDKTIMKRSDE